MRFVVGLSCLLSVVAVRADEATLPDGRRLMGAVEPATVGRLQFVAAKQALRLDAVHHIRFPPVVLPALRPARLHRVTLRDGQFVTGELLGLDERSLNLRTSWAGRLAIPRAWVAAVANLPGWVPVFTDDFETDSKAWKLTGTPSLSDRQQTSGRHSLCLNAVGQTAGYVLPAALAAGRIGVNFHDPGESAGARWVCEAEFEGAGGPQLVRVVLAGDAPTYSVEVPGGVASGAVPRKAGWHHLAIEFTAGSLIVTVDDLVLWPPPVKKGQTAARHGPAGPLHELRLKCVAATRAGPMRGELCVDDLCLAQAAAEPARSLADATQDEVCLLSGDQLFGSVLHCDSRTLEMRGRFGARVWAWSEVHGIQLRREAIPARTTDGEHVHIWVRTGWGGQPDEVEGTVQTLDDRRLTLLHATLGELAIDRGRLERLRWLFHGRRLEIDNGMYHLGRKLVPDLPVPRPTGLELRRTFQLDAVPNETRLVVSVVGLKGPGDSPAIAHALERGGLRTEVVVNRRVVDYLNRHGERSSQEPRRLRIALPRTVLQVGANEVILRQTEDRATGRYEDCVIAGLVVESPR